ncbi:SPOR domain-containing protein [Alteromonadaceae bacterium BrNp21-10]|nr:SPOR domain-containing protein [Alteromonadaceae bacterium BrNp21-10]
MKLKCVGVKWVSWLLVSMFSGYCCAATSESPLIFADDFSSSIMVGDQNLGSIAPSDLSKLSKSSVTEKYAFGHYYEWRKNDRKYGDNIGCIGLQPNPHVLVQCEDNVTAISYLKLPVILGNSYEKIRWLSSNSNMATTLDISILGPQHVRQKKVIDDQWLSIIKTIGGRYFTLGLCITQNATLAVACLDFPKESVDEFDVSFLNDDALLSVKGILDGQAYNLFFDLASKEFITHAPEVIAPIKHPAVSAAPKQAKAQPSASNMSNTSPANHCVQIANFTEEENARIYANKLNRFHKNIGLHPKLIGEQQWYSVILVADSVEALTSIREDVSALLKVESIGFNISCPQF